MKTGDERRRLLYLGLAVFVVALAIRLIGIGWGLPNDVRNQSLHPDEPVVLAYSQQIEPVKGRFTPGFYNYGTLYLTITRIATDVVSAYTGATQDEPFFLLADATVRETTGLTTEESDELDAIFAQLSESASPDRSLTENQASVQLAAEAAKELIGPKKWRSLEKMSASNFRKIYLAGRVVSAVAGALTAVVVLLMLLPRAGTFGSLFGAAAMAFAPGHVVHSRFQTVDVLATLFLALSLYFALRLAAADGDEGPDDTGYVRLALWSGVFAGLSAGTKYTGILALVALAAVLLLDVRKVRWQALAIGVVASLIAFIVATPGAVLDSARFLEDFKYEITHTGAGHGLVFAGTSPGLIFHAWNLFVCFGLLLTTVSVIGLVRACVKRHRWAIALAAFAVVYYLLIGRAEVKFMRYVFPLLPVLAVAFGWIVSRAHTHPKPLWRGPVMVLAIVGLGGLGGGVVGALGGGLSLTATMTTWMVGEDVRDAVAQEIIASAEPGDTVGLVSDPWFYTPSLFPDAGLSRAVPFDVRNAKMKEASDPAVVRYIPRNPDERFDWDKRLVTELRPDYIVFSSFEWRDVARIRMIPSPPDEYKIQIGRAEEFMDALKTHYTQWKVHGLDGLILPHDLMYVRPEIEVWKRNPDSTTTSTSSSTPSSQSEEPAGTP
ncbi:MAG: glycosyltransferase family 39 protein [Armatimonadetes bacterium]|nr:glycosyltransferase family 39 protein [Armatimonadota bacterium]